MEIQIKDKPGHVLDTARGGQPELLTAAFGVVG
jgi:hypothetical protein